METQSEGFQQPKNLNISLYQPKDLFVIGPRIQMCKCNQYWVLFNIEYPSETHFKLKHHETLFGHIICLRNPIVLKFCTEQWYCRAMCKIPRRLDYLNGCYGRRDFARFGFKMSFGRMSYIAQHPRINHTNQYHHARVITHCAPLPIVINLQATFHWKHPIHETNFCVRA